MDIDKKQIMKKIENMSDDELKNIVSEIARGAGVSEKRVSRTVSDISKLRQGLSGMTDRDLQKALSLLDAESAEKIKRQMNM